jgi:hypothetical protein
MGDVFDTTCKGQASPPAHAGCVAALRCMMCSKYEGELHNWSQSDAGTSGHVNEELGTTAAQ